MRCERCLGRKKMYQFNDTYTHTNMGAKEVTCPDCAGTGQKKIVSTETPLHHDDHQDNAAGSQKILEKTANRKK